MSIGIDLGVFGEDPRCKKTIHARNVQRQGITCFSNLTYESGRSGQGVYIYNSNPENCHGRNHCKYFLDNSHANSFPRSHIVKTCSDVFCCSSKGICDKANNIARVSFLTSLLIFFLSCALTMYWCAKTLRTREPFLEWS